MDDFTAHAWCNQLLADPTITHGAKGHQADKGATGSNTFFNRTLSNGDAIRAYLTLWRPGNGRTREVDGPLIVKDGASIHDIPLPDDYELKMKRQKAKEEVAFDIADPDAAEMVCLVSVGSDLDGGQHRLHGGITATLLDQTMGLLISYSYVGSGVTLELNVKYKKAIVTPGVLKVRAKLVREKGRWIEAWGSVEDGLGTVFAEGRGTFLLQKFGNVKL